MQQCIVKRMMMAAFLLLALAAPGAFAATEAGFVLVATSGVTAFGADGTQRTLTRRSPFLVGDRIVTGPAGRAQLKFTDGAIVALKPASELRVDDYAYTANGGEQKSVMSLVKGGFRTVTGAVGKNNRAGYKVSTPVATIGIRGTFYESNFDENAGLSLGVWDGGIVVCNDEGCLDLGADADHRFGFVPLKGKPEGRDEPPEGVGDDGLGGSPGGPAAGDGAGEVPGARHGGQTDDSNQPRYEDAGLYTQITLPPPPPPPPPPPGPSPSPSPGPAPEPVPEMPVPAMPPVASAGPDRELYPFSGLGVVNGGGNPWGSERLLVAEYGRATPVYFSEFLSYDWALWSSTAGGQFLLPGADCSSSLCYPGAPTVVSGIGKGGSTVLWGAWFGDDVRLSLEDMSDPLTGVPVTNAGLYVLGDNASSQVIATSVGQATFTLLDGGGYWPYLQLLRGGELLTPAFASGSLRVDLGSGTASGFLAFSAQDYSTYDTYEWHLGYSGSVSTDGFALSPNGGGTQAANGSYFRWWQTSSETLVEESLDGKIAAAFFGTDVVDGVLGAFDLFTESGAGDVQGTFVLGRDLAMSGFALVGAGTANDWGSRNFLDIEPGFAKIDDSYWPPYVLDASFWAPNAGTGRYFTRCTGDCGGLGGSNVLLGAETGARMVWGSWGSSDLSTYPSFTGGSETYLQNAGVFVMGDLLAPADALSALNGVNTFSLVGNPSVGLTVLDSTSPWAYSPASASGSMTIDKVDMFTGMISGNLSWTSVAMADYWSLDYSGTLTENSVHVVVDDSSFVYVSQNEVPSSVGGTMKVGVVGGAGAVDGVIGAFDVHALDESRSAQGVFVMQPALP